MVYLILGLIVFLGAHSVRIVAEDWRNATRARMGENAYKGIYSLVSLAGFARTPFLLNQYPCARLPIVAPAHHAIRGLDVFSPAQSPPDFLPPASASDRALAAAIAD